MPAETRFPRRLMHKPLNVLVHQLGGGITRVGPPATVRVIGIGPGDRTPSWATLPQSLEQGRFRALCNSVPGGSLRRHP
jgi:hypothetical protein